MTTIVSCMCKLNQAPFDGHILLNGTINKKQRCNLQVSTSTLYKMAAKNVLFLLSCEIELSSDMSQDSGCTA